MKDNAKKTEEDGVEPILEVPQTEEQQLQQSIEDGTHEVCIMVFFFLFHSFILFHSSLRVM